MDIETITKLANIRARAKYSDVINFEITPKHFEITTKQNNRNYTIVFLDGERFARLEDYEDGNIEDVLAIHIADKIAIAALKKT